jgi:hypothetical protein
MTEISAVAVPKLESVRIEFISPETIRLEGSIQDREATADLTAFFRAIHSHALNQGLPVVRVDVSALTFVNASGIRLFIDWVTWVSNERARPYSLRFLTSRLITWQKVTFQALSALTKGVVEIERID